MEEYPAVCEDGTFVRGSASKEYGSHACGLSDAICGDVASDETHGVVYRKASCDGSAG